MKASTKANILIAVIVLTPSIALVAWAHWTYATCSGHDSSIVE